MTAIHAEPPRRIHRPDLIGWVLIGIVAVGAVVRFGGIGWGLPSQLHADEWVVVEGAIDMAQRNSFAPPFFFRPDHLETQLSYIVFQAWSHLIGGGTPESLFAIDQAPFYALARSVTAMLGTASIVVAYLIGRAYTRSTGLISAFAVAFFPPLVEHSRYATPDVPLVFAVLVTILGAVRYIQTERWMWLALSSAGVSIGITAKYPAVAATVAIAVAVIVASIRSRRYWRILWRGVAAMAMVLGFTFLLSPTLFTDFSAVRAQLLQQNSTGHLGADGLDSFGNALFYATSFAEGGGVIVVLFAIVGLVHAVALRRWDMAPLLTGIAFWAGISLLTLHWDRWGLPMFVSPLLLAAVGVDAAWRWTANRRGWRKAVVAVASVSAASLLLGSVSMLAIGLAPDNRTTAAVDLAARGLSADDLFYDGYTPFHTDGPRNLAAELEIVRGIVTPRPGVDPLPFVLTSSSMVDRYLLADNLPEPKSVYEALGELPVDTVWETASVTEPSPWEPVRIWQSAESLVKIFAGGSGGPELVLHRLPDPGEH